MRLVCLFLLISISSLAKTDSLPVGTVIYSIIPPKEFIAKNQAWMLMDGCDTALSRLVYGTPDAALNKFQRSLLHAMPIEILPDARGLFIRAMNLDRDKTKGDADGNRTAGTEQQDTYKRHSHAYTDHFPTGTRSDNANDRDVGTPNGSSRTPRTSEEGDDETRPRNIALYVYIKVN